MTNWQRVFAFVTGAFAFGLTLIVLSHRFIQFVSSPRSSGYLFLIGFGLVYLSINLALSRRFVMKAINLQWVCYTMAVLTIIPQIFWVFTKDVGFGMMPKFEFTLTLIFSALLGAFFGIRRGIAKREVYLQKLREQQERQDLPDSLRRPHDDLSNN